TAGQRLLLTEDGRVYRIDGSWVDKLILLGCVLAGPITERAIDCHSIEHYLQQLGVEKNSTEWGIS
ncbi:MAG: hypothetical protein MUE50_15385, partial [Pirellulaceae bacterium]|nr:hypothetical protein [Pirellulaceae bacterium]